MRSTTRLGLCSTAVAIAITASPASALANDTFVDQTRPDDSDPTCSTPATACKTIVSAMLKTSIDGTIFVVDPVAPTTYAETVLLNDGKSLVSLSSDPGEVIIDNGAGGGISPAVFIPPAGVGGDSAVKGFTIRSEFQAILAQRQATISGNIFDEGGPLTSPGKADVLLDDGAGDSEVSGNAFDDPTPTAGQNQFGLSSNSSGSPLLKRNTFSDFQEAIYATAGSPQIVDNQITGARQGNNAGVGIGVIGGHPTITHNRISQPFFATPSDFIFGISLNQIGGDPLGATLARNSVLGERFGISVTNTGGAVSLNGDLIAGSTGTGLSATDSGSDDPGLGDLTATNVTVFDTDDGDPGTSFDVDIIVNNAVLTLNSTIVEKPITASGSGTCAITFSRGPTASGSSCQTFQTTATPGFVDSSAGDYHLMPGSPMIESGDPTAPAAASKDLDGERRAADGTGSCLDAPRRDIGADEFECSPPNTKITKGPLKRTHDRNPTFRFYSSGTGDSFRCKLDAGPYVACDTPKKYGKKAIGRHTFRVKAVSPEGLVDPAPAKRRFRIVR